MVRSHEVRRENPGLLRDPGPRSSERFWNICSSRIIHQNRISRQKSTFVFQIMWHFKRNRNSKINNFSGVLNSSVYLLVCQDLKHLINDEQVCSKTFTAEKRPSRRLSDLVESLYALDWLFRLICQYKSKYHARNQKWFYENARRYVS